MSDFESPWEFHPDLTEDRLVTVADLLRQERNNFVASIDVEEVRWGAGCFVYDATRNRIFKERLNHDWLDVIDHSMAFIFMIGQVPVRFYRGEPDTPTQNTLARRNTELNQISLAFDDEYTDIIWRFAVDTDVDGTVIQVSFVGLNANDDVVSKWDYSLDDVVTEFGGVDGDLGDRLEGVDIEPPVVLPKGSEKTGEKQISKRKAQAD